jgi:hypothetical protein
MDTFNIVVLIAIILSARMAMRLIVKFSEYNDEDKT